MKPRNVMFAVLVGSGLAAMVGCGSSGGSSKRSTPGSVNVLPTASTSTAAGATPASASAGSSSSSAAGATPASSSAGSSSSSAPAANPAPAAPAANPAPAAPAAPAQPEIYGTIPPDPATGFNGSLYLVGERLVPGSVVQVTVNGTPIKVLPALFHSSELLSIPVWFTIAADYEFAALAPDGTLSVPVKLTVPNGGLTSVLGLGTPDIQMAFPPSVDTQFTGTVWLMGQEFAPGCVVTVTPAGQTPYVVPLLFVNDRTVGWVIPAPLTGDVSLQITNPTLLNSQTITLSVQGSAQQPGAPVAPQFSAPAQVSSPFVGTVHLTGSDLQQGAYAELRVPGGALSLTVPLIRVSSVEAWLTLVYPPVGSYELRVVNPSGDASPWAAFDVR